MVPEPQTDMLSLVKTEGLGTAITNVVKNQKDDAEAM
jgi:hypothetical protein